jgi:hypothetical protein
VSGRQVYAAFQQNVQGKLGIGSSEMAFSSILTAKASIKPRQHTNQQR